MFRRYIFHYVPYELDMIKAGEQEFPCSLSPLFTSNLIS